MIPAPLPDNEEERLAALKRYGILDTELEKDYNDMVLLASSICQTPISLISLIDGDRQWFKARKGVDDNELSRDTAFCAHVLLESDVMVVPNALQDERFHDNPYVLNNPNVRFYAGMPLITSEGYSLGSLCVIDNKPRELNEQQLFALRVLGKRVVGMIEGRSLNKRLRELNSMQGKFLSIISHDVKNPLYALNGLLDLFTDEAITHEQLVELTIESKKHINLTLSLLDDLMKWSASGISSGETVFVPLQLHALAEEQLKHFEAAADAKSISLHNAVPAGSTIMGDANMLQFIIRNLLANAVKFTSGGSIKVAAVQTSTGWQISVADTGIGMSEEKKGRLFNWQSRYTTSGTNNEPGTGLGLLLCREFVHRHRGELNVESSEGKGSTFAFSVNTAGLAKGA